MYLYTYSFFLIAILTAKLTLSPIKSLADKLTNKKPNDLNYINDDLPIELTPLMNSLNGLIRKLKIILKQTEIFISAAHHIKTPLAVVKSESEIALIKSKNPENRDHLKNIIKSINDANRSTTQLLDQQ